LAARIVILNGTSSSGKTTLVRAMQAIWDGPLLHVGLDHVISMLPFAYTGDGEHAAAGYEVVREPDEDPPLTRYAVGPIGRRMNRHLAELAARLADDGFDVVVDHVITDDETLRELAAVCGPRRTFLVAVTCDEAVTNARERRRGDRAIGLARYQAPLVHEGQRPYDLTLDTSGADADALASQARGFVVSSAPAGLRGLG
jgi:chloramphenicol 3-O phosphotransferase